MILSDLLTVLNGNTNIHVSLIDANEDNIITFVINARPDSLDDALLALTVRKIKINSSSSISIFLSAPVNEEQENSEP